MNRQASQRFVEEFKEDTTRSALKLLLLGDVAFAESGFVTFEKGRAAKDAEIGNIGFPLVAEFIGSDGDTI